MYDWNENGKYDPQDGFIDYQIYNSSKQLGVNNSDDSGGCLFWICFLLVLIVFPPIGILMILYAMFSK